MKVHVHPLYRPLATPMKLTVANQYASAEKMSLTLTFEPMTLKTMSLSSGPDNE